MDARTTHLITHALALLALTACGDKDVSDSGDSDGDGDGDGRAYSGDYGTCDPDEVDAATEVRWPVVVEKQADDSDWIEVAGGTLPDLEDGEDVLLCFDPEGADLECPENPAEDSAWSFAWSTSVDRVLSEFDEPAPDHHWELSQYCGPMELDGACCWTLGFHSEEDEDDGTDEGRPFLVQGARRIAATVPRGGWCTTLEPAPAAAADVPVLVARWTGAGRAEHASVAAFSRFGMVLMHHGAPADLVRAAHEAALDEVRHAELCFGLASAYAGEIVGPGPLDVAGSLIGELDLDRMVRTLVAEGCVGETLAALEAGEAARLCTDPAVKSVLEGITADESRHAGLAWKTLRWLVARHPELRGVALDALADARVGRPSTGVSHLEHLGVLSPTSRDRVRALGHREVVAALAADVLGTPAVEMALEA
jgi:hypothetical protein